MVVSTFSLDGSILERARFPFDPYSEDHSLALEIALAAARRQVEKLRESERILIGVGLAIGGLVDRERREIIFSPHLGYRKVSLGGMFEVEFGVPVFLDNDARALALSEQWLGLCQGSDHLICISVGGGVGAGVIVQGRLQYGAHDSIGEIGHMVIERDGPECVCGKKGCLEVFAGGEAVLREVCRRIDEGEKSSLKNLLVCSQQQNTYELIANAAEAGDGLAKEELLRAAEYLGIGISHAINTFDPQRIVLGGRLVQCSRLMVERAVAVARHQIFNERARDIPIAVTELGDEAVSTGAAILVFQDFFDRGGIATERA